MPRSTLLLALLLLSPALNAELLNDPTRPPPSKPAKTIKTTAAAPSLPKLLLNGIAIARDGKGHSTIINGQRVAVGDRVAGARVEEIRPAAVQLSHGRQRITLEFAPGVHKRRSRRE